MGQQQNQRREPNQGQSQRHPDQRTPKDDRPQRDESREPRKQS
jgi:hypothetical protein